MGFRYQDGVQPYQSLVDTQSVIYFVETGKRIPRRLLPGCSLKVYTVLSECWDADPSCRPTFADLVKRLTCIQQTARASEGGIINEAGNGQPRETDSTSVNGKKRRPGPLPRSLFHSDGTHTTGDGDCEEDEYLIVEDGTADNISGNPGSGGKRIFGSYAIPLPVTPHGGVQRLDPAVVSTASTRSVPEDYSSISGCGNHAMGSGGIIVALRHVSDSVGEMMDFSSPTTPLSPHRNVSYAGAIAFSLASREQQETSFGSGSGHRLVPLPPSTPSMPSTATGVTDNVTWGGTKPMCDGNRLGLRMCDGNDTPLAQAPPGSPNARPIEAGSLLGCISHFCPWFAPIYRCMQLISSPSQNFLADVCSDRTRWRLWSFSGILTNAWVA